MDESESLEAVFGDVPAELYNLIEERNVNDLHCGNYGFIDEKPVIYRRILTSQFELY